MDTQQLIALGLVGIAAGYLGRQFVLSARNFFSKRSGCGGGCGKCSFAREISQQSVNKSNTKVMNIIPLVDVRTASDDKPNNSGKDLQDSKPGVDLCISLRQ